MILHYHTYQTAFKSQYFVFVRLSHCECGADGQLLADRSLNLTYKTGCAINNVTVYPAIMDICSKTRIYVYYVCVSSSSPPPRTTAKRYSETGVTTHQKGAVVAGRTT